MRRAYVTLVGVCTGWGTIPLVIRHVDLPAAAIVSARVWLAALGLGVFVAFDRRPAVPLGSTRRGLAVVTGTILAVHWLALFAAYQRAPAGTVILVVYLAPVGIAALAPSVLHERLSRRALFALLGLALVGFVLIGAPAAGGAQAAGVALAVVAAVLFVALVLLSKPLAEEYGGVRAALLEFTVAGIVLVPVAARAAWGHPRAAWGYLLVLGLVHTAVGTALYLGALARVPATHTGILGYLEPASVLVCAWVFLGEHPGPSTWLGGALIGIGGIAVVTTPTVRSATVEVPVGAG